MTTSAWLGTKAVPTALCVGITFDKQGYLIAAAIKIDMDSYPMTSNVVLTLIDPHTLATLATFPLPGETYYPGYRPAGTYFYQDQLDRTIVGTVDNEIWVVSHQQTERRLDASPTPTTPPTWDLTAVVKDGDAIEALAPDFAGRVWVTTKNGVVATVDADTGKLLGSNDDMKRLRRDHRQRARRVRGERRLHRLRLRHVPLRRRRVRPAGARPGGSPTPRGPA